MPHCSKLLSIIAAVFVVSGFLAWPTSGQTVRTVYLPIIVTEKDPDATSTEKPLSPTATPTHTPEPTATETNTPEPTATETHTPTPVEGPGAIVAVLGSTTVVTSKCSNTLYIVGEVENTGNQAADRVQIIARFYQGDTLVGTENTYTSLWRVFAGERGAFRFIVLDPPLYDRYELEVVWEEPITEVEYVPVKILNTNTHDYLSHKVFGEIQNTTTKELSAVLISVTFYDINNNVVSVEYATTIISPLPPNGISTFDATTDRNLIYNRYTVDAQGYYIP
jgi:hypothetical protein